ncbi:hypothetical protein NA57DRAFT_43907, partial [Rhizodiscina lignyota]
VPNFLRPTLQPVLHAPVSHITSFLILHELTAIVPLVSLAAAFHYTNWLPPYITEGAWVKQGMERFGRYFHRKGWLGEEGSKREGTWNFSEKGVKIVLEVATAWAVTKLLLPVRLIVSVWATPWFARVFVLRITGWIGKLFGGGKGKAAAGVGAAAGTGATAAGAIPKVKNEGPLYRAANGGTSGSSKSPASATSTPDPNSPSVKNDGPLYKNTNQTKPSE